MFLTEEIIAALKAKQSLLSHDIESRRWLPSLLEIIRRKIRGIVKTNPKKKQSMIVGITVTDKCNLNCIYCYQKFKSNKSITQLTAKQIITRILSAQSTWTDIEFRILGGEPFTEPQLLRDILDWTLRNHWEKKYQFRISTNGTMLDNELKKWISRNKKSICLILSLDGSSDFHNKNRSFSYEKIDFNFFKTNWPEQPIKMTINKESIYNLTDSVIHVMNLGFYVSFSLAGGENWDKNDLEVFRFELKKIEKLFSNCSIKVPPIFNINFIRVLNTNDSTRQCGIGKNIVVYDTEGRPYPCHLFLPNTLNMNYEEIPKISFFSDDNVLKDEFCTTCAVKNICPTCYSYNFVERHESSARDHKLCDFMKEIIKSAVVIKAQRLLRTKNSLLSDNTIKEIESLLYINEFI